MADSKADPMAGHVEEITVEAQVATADEHSLTVREAFRRYPKAVLWSAVMSLTIVMEGYDLSLMFSFFSYPSFAKKYGSFTEDHGYLISTPWQTSLGLGATVGAFISLLFNGRLTERFGHRLVLMAALVFMTGVVFMQFFAPSVEVLQAAQVLAGLPWGIFAVMGPTYASEVCPLALRGYLTAYVNLCWVIGQLIGAGVLQGLVSNNTEWGYRIPFAIQWVWPLPLFILTYLAPNSPYWLVRKGRVSEAEASIRRLSSNLTDEQIQNSLALIDHTNRLEQSLTAESSYWDCFKGTNLRRTEIACMSLLAQASSGQVLVYTPAYFLIQAGFSPDSAYKINFGASGCAFIATCVSWFLMTYYGRRPLFIYGMSVMTAVLLVIGALTYSASESAKWAQGGLAVVWLAIYSSTLGPQSFTIAAEISATRVRAETISLARNSYYLVSILANVIEPQLINPTAANLKGKTAFFWMATSFLTVLWAVFRLPESKDRTYEELDLLFEKKLPAWRFASTDINAIRGMETNELEKP